MPRRVRLPSADDLFRPTDEDSTGAHVRAVPPPAAPAETDAEAEPARVPRPSGRVRHDEKMTVYVTSEELLRIEHARLALRSQHGLAVDRGRLVREALALVLGDLETQGDDCALVRRLSEG